MFKESLGEYLRQERELRQISLEEVAEGTKIAIYRLRAMEADRWEELPAEVFKKGFIKSYAEFIGLVPEDVILRYQEMQSADEKSVDEPTGPANKTLFNYVNKVALFNNNKSISAAAAIFLILLLLVLAFWFFRFME